MPRGGFYFDALAIDPQACVANAQRFDVARLPSHVRVRHARAPHARLGRADVGEEGDEGRLAGLAPGEAPLATAGLRTSI